MSNYQRKPNYKCVICNTDMYVRPSAIKASKGWGFTCSKECGKQNRSKHTIGIANHQYGIKGEQNASFTGYEKVNQYGYKLIYKPDHPRANHAGYCYEHNLVMEEHLGRALKFIHYKHPDNEVCHHIDRNKLNNSIDNLQLMTEKTHFELHKKEDDYASTAGATKASFTKQEASTIKKEYENTDVTQRDLAKKYNTCQGVISSIILEKGNVMNNNCDCKNCEHWESCEFMLLLSSPTRDYHINAGDKIAQALLLEHKSYLFNIQSDTERTGGFGSTGA